MNAKNLIREMMKIAPRYDVTGVTIVELNKHDMVMVTMTSNVKMPVYGVPNTTGTETKHVAQNILKRARTAHKQNLDRAAYSGGK